MMKSLAMCLAAALLGAMAAIYFTRPTSGPRLSAQEPGLSAQFRPGGAGPATGRRGGPPAKPAANDFGDLTPEERINVTVYDTVNMSVVNINTKSVRAESFFFIEIPSEGTGSGSVLDAKGHVLTNYHVVEGAREIQVTLFNGQSFDARLVGEDATNDIAVLQIDAPPGMLYPVNFGDSSKLRVGQFVYAIGNPFGLERTLTTGVISSLNRSLPSRHNRTLKSIIQIDAAINPGSSGGPLLDSRSRLIGMNTAIASRTGQSSGVGFAIPVNTIARIVPQLIESGRVIRPDAGVIAVYQAPNGLRIAQLVPGGPAEQAGLRGPRTVRRGRGPLVYESIDRSAADLIVAVDGQPAQTADEFLTAIESHRPGDEVTITVLRDNQELHVRVRLDKAES